MKTLLLLRHAKSSWDDPTLKDFDRPLNDRGAKAAPLIGKFIRQKRVRPDLIISSPAKRARQTAELVLQATDLSSELRFDERIYEASARTLLEVVSQIEDAANIALLIGHNPGFEDLFGALTSKERRLPTAALACIEMPIEKWSEVRPEIGQLKWFTTPKKLKGD